MWVRGGGITSENGVTQERGREIRSKREVSDCLTWRLFGDALLMGLWLRADGGCHSGYSSQRTNGEWRFRGGGMKVEASRWFATPGRDGGR